MFASFILLIGSDKMLKPNMTKGATTWSGSFINIADYEHSTLALTGQREQPHGVVAS